MSIEAYKDELVQLLDTKRVLDDTSSLTQYSKDYYWFSPILKKSLSECRADVVAKPNTQAELIAIVRLAAQHKIPITPRGKGTGNYGQGVPLAGGLVLDTSRLKTIYGVGDGYIHAEAGANFVQLESAAREYEQELAMFPSTFNSCLGGFIGGGAGGTGSVENGFIFNHFVQALKILPCTENAEPFWVYGDDTVPYVHAYGVTGIILEAKVKLVPAREWVACFFSFEPNQWRAACLAALDLIHMATKPRLVSLEQPEFIPFFPKNNWLKPNTINLRAMLSTESIDTAKTIIARHGGHFIGRDTSAKTLDMLSLLSYNHPTLWVKNQRPDYCHLQISGPPLWEAIDDVNACLPDSLLHCEARWVRGKAGLGGVFLSRFVDEETLMEGIQQLEALGCFVMNVHTYMLGTDHLPTVDDLYTYSSQNDPHGLLNPGKIPERVLT